MRVSEDSAADYYETGIDFLTNNGFDHYEVSNFSRSRISMSAQRKLLVGEELLRLRSRGCKLY